MRRLTLEGCAVRWLASRHSFHCSFLVLYRTCAPMPLSPCHASPKVFCLPHIRPMLVGIVV